MSPTRSTALVIEVKRVVRDLRPTALDQLGLIDAVGEFTRTFGDDLEFHLTMPTAPVELPAAVEVAAYRIVTEAVTNVVRHAQAAQCWLSISTGPTVDIDVVDDGIGVVGRRVAGCGMDGDARAGDRARRQRSGHARTIHTAPTSTFAFR